MKNRFLTFFIALLTCFVLSGQTGWTWTELNEMPEKVSNNAVVEGFIGNDAYVYSFSGIDTTKVYSGINLGSYRYDVNNNTWMTLPDLPDTLGKIAAGVSRVGDKLYIIGGYHVLPGGNEVSSDRVHVFNVLTNSFETDGAKIPVPIDDHVQCVYKDSLIYVITGWSNTGNVPDVQIYNPSLDQWTVGTATPSTTIYTSFGASGTIVGDTIFYNGGVRGGFNFAATNYTRRGVINPQDPTQITWSQVSNNPGATGYRMACSNYEDKVFWVGGGGVAYNYNGIAYYGGAGVEPLDRILQLKTDGHLWDEGLGTPYLVMDLRGIAKVSDTEWIICGGMESGQKVSDKTYLLTYDPVVGGLKGEEWGVIDFYPNPVMDALNLGNDFTNAQYQIIELSGKLVDEGVVSNSINVSKLPSGFYILVLNQKGQYFRAKFEKE